MLNDKFSSSPWPTESFKLLGDFMPTHFLREERERKGTLPCNDTGILFTRFCGGLDRSRTKQPHS